MTDQMPDLDFEVEGVRAVPFCAVPTLGFNLAVRSSQPIEAVSLDCQIRIEAQLRRYDHGEQAALFELFGPVGDWSRSLRSLLWTHASVSMGSFEATTTVELPVPCTYDFNVISTKFFTSLGSGYIPLLLLFSGAVFYGGGDGGLQVGRVAWTKEARFNLPVAVWQDLMDLYYPNSAWLCLHRDTFSQLAAFKAAHALPTWEAALDRLLSAAGEGATR